MHSDESNPYIETLEGFEAEIKKFKPAALVVGGLQMLDNFPFEEGNNNYFVNHIPAHTFSLRNSVFVNMLLNNLA